MIELRYLLVAVACVLVLLISLILMKYRKLLRTKEVNISKEEVVCRIFTRKIKELEESGENQDPKELFNKLNKTMRGFFSELYDIEYEFAYVELNEELVKKDVSEDIRNAIIDYTMNMAESEYSNHAMTGQEFYYLLGKSIKIIEKVSQYTEEKPGEKQPETVESMPDAAEKQKPSEEKPSEPVADVRGVPSPKPEPVPVTKGVQKVPVPDALPVDKAPKPSEKMTETQDTEIFEAFESSDEFSKPSAAKMQKKIKPEKKITTDKPETVTKPEKKPEIHEDKQEVQAAIIPKTDKTKVDKIRHMLFAAEMGISENKPAEAMDNYRDLRIIYDSLTPEMKLKINPETKRIIALYNSLLAKFKDTLLGNK